MTLSLIIAVLTVETVLLIAIERRSFGTYLTPTAILTLPYIAIVLLTALFSPLIGFVGLYPESVVVWVVAIPFFAVPGLTFLVPVSGRVRKWTRAGYEPRLQSENAARRIVLLGAWASIVVLIYAFWAALRHVGGPQGIITEEFQRVYGSGLFGHVRTFSMVCFIYLLGETRLKDRLSVTAIVFLGMLYVAYQVKGGIILPVIAGLLYRKLTGRLGITLGRSALGLILLYVVLNLTYFVGFDFKDVGSFLDPAAYSAVAKSLVYYLFAGVLGFSRAVQEGTQVVEADQMLVFAPILNLFAAATGQQSISYVTEYVSQIEQSGVRLTNVHTFFGTLYMFLPLVTFLGYSAFIGVVAYVLFAAAALTRNAWALVAYCYVAAGLFMGWFEFYFWALSFVELPTYAACMALASATLRGKPVATGDAAMAS